MALKDMRVSLPRIGQAVYYHFLSHFCLHPGHRKSLKGKTYPALDFPLHGESNGVNFILVEDCSHKL